MSRRAVNQRSLECGHEGMEASAKGLAVFAACFIVGLAGLMAITIPLWRWAMPPTPSPAEIVRAPSPNLQPSPRDPQLDYQYLQSVNREYRDQFAVRGWVQADGKVRVPKAIVAKVIAESKSQSSTQGGGR